LQIGRLLRATNEAAPPTDFSRSEAADRGALGLCGSFFVFAEARFDLALVLLPLLVLPPGLLLLPLAVLFIAVALISISYYRWGFADAMPVRMS